MKNEEAKCDLFSCNLERETARLGDITTDFSPYHSSYAHLVLVSFVWSDDLWTNIGQEIQSLSNVCQNSVK